MTARIISVINQKGGVGKTTTASNLSHGLALKGKRVLAIDLDPQAHLASSLGITKPDIAGLDAVFLKEISLSQVQIKIRENLLLVSAGSHLNEVENMEGGKSRGLLLKKAIDNYDGNVDYIIIDSPPSSGLLVVNALFATEEILIPMTGDYLGMQGLSHLMATLKNFEQALQKKYRQWIVLSRFHERRKLSQEVKDKLISYFPGSVLKTSVSEAAVLAESPGFGQSIFEYKAKCKSSEEYTQLVDDLVKGRVYK